MNQKRRAQKVARKLPNHMQDIVFSKYRKQTKKLGKFGAASGVRKIDPATIDLSKYLED